MYMYICIHICMYIYTYIYIYTYTHTYIYREREIGVFHSQKKTSDRCVPLPKKDLMMSFDQELCGRLFGGRGV